MTQHDVWLALANTEAEDITNGTCQDLHTTITASMMITMGMEHEQSQWVSIYFPAHRRSKCLIIRVKLQHDRSLISTNSATSLQLAKLKEWDNALRQAINAWMKIQELFMPVAAAQWEHDNALANDEVPEPNAEDICLYLPSSIPEASCRYVNVHLWSYEFQLHEAQAYEALDELQYQDHHLRIFIWIVQKRKCFNGTRLLWSWWLQSSLMSWRKTKT